jgi:hypothetical protein
MVKYINDAPNPYPNSKTQYFAPLGLKFVSLWVCYKYSAALLLPF